MKKYPTMNNWWYLGIFASCVAMALGTTYGAKSGLPWWGLFLSLLFAWLFLPIIGTVRSLLLVRGRMLTVTSSSTVLLVTPLRSKTWFKCWEVLYFLVDLSPTYVFLDLMVYFLELNAPHRCTSRFMVTTLSSWPTVCSET